LSSEVTPTVRFMKDPHSYMIDCFIKIKLSPTLIVRMNQEDTYKKMKAIHDLADSFQEGIEKIMRGE
jgi:hypothetical protein